ncbi:sensor histidine kinase [Rummeliibacillus stabekisii]|uniref:sensor histidine kinase n=1 Tax=Rummeliibacillus stabekisii TaxID=241244 RepID=UPI00371B3C7B
MKFNIRIALIIAAFSLTMLLIITAILLYKGHEHLMMLRLKDAEEVIHHFDMALAETAVWSIGLLFIIILVSSFFIARTLTKPIQELNHFALQLVKGKRDLNITYTIDDQIGQLGQSLKTLDKTLSVYEVRRKEMTQDLAHEIRNPLASVKSYLSAFEDGVWKATPKRLEGCIEEIDRLILLVGELDTLNDINSPTFKINKQLHQVAPIIESAVISLASELLEKKIEVNLTLDQSIFASVDSLRLNQILHNIIKNALFHLPVKGTLAIQLLNKSQDELQIIISDNGSGMDEETSSKLFERHYRGQNNYKGSGIGMTITKKLVEAHGGQVFVKSLLDKGTTFTISLPISS